MVLVDRIQTAGNDNCRAHTYYPVAIIGAGESGICMGAKLQMKLKCDQFRIFEKRSSLGGTCPDETSPAVIYSFSFAQNSKWTTLYPTGDEIVGYLREVCSKYKLLDKIQCDTNVKTARWLEDIGVWELVLEHLTPGTGDMSTAERKAYESAHPEKPTILSEETIRAKVLISAVGGLVEPKEPIDVPGKDQFQGQIVHTARWDSSVHLTDKNVVVIGTGCSAAQVVTELKRGRQQAKSVTQIMRSPPWVTPVLSKSGTATWKKWMPTICRIPGLQNMIRKLMYIRVELEWFSLFAATEVARKRRQEKRKDLLDYMQQSVPQKYHSMLTPDYEVFCKRRVIDDGWFAALCDSDVELTTRKPKSLTSNSLILGAESLKSTGAEEKHSDEKEVPCDILVMANGYQTNEWIHPLNVLGCEGRTLRDVWSQQGGAGAYLGTAVHGFPNFFMVFGPNTATGHSSVILASENMCNYAIDLIRPLLKHNVKRVEVKQSAEQEYTSEVQKALKNSVYNSGGAKNWYIKDDWNSTTYPRSQIDFWLRCHFPRLRHWHVEYTQRGLTKLVLTMGLRFTTLLCLYVNYIQSSPSRNIEVYGVKLSERVATITTALLVAKGFLKYIA